MFRDFVGDAEVYSDFVRCNNCEVFMAVDNDGNTRPSCDFAGGMMWADEIPVLNKNNQTRRFDA